MKEKKEYQAPMVKRIRLDVKSSVMGWCQQTPDWIVAPTCQDPVPVCPSQPNGTNGIFLP